MFPEISGLMLFALLIVSVWELVWKGLGLWHSAKNGQKGWFVVILIFNTLGLLPIIYLLWFRKCISCRAEVKTKSVKRRVTKGKKSRK